MAYKQNPGRGNNAKTGHGLPSPFRQDAYRIADEAELNSKTGGVTRAANKILDKFPAQNKHLRSNVQKDEKGNVLSYELKPNSKKAVEQVQIARDSMNYIGDEKDPVIREKKGRDFSFNFSPNNPYGKKAVQRAGGEYQGPNKISGSPEAKKKVLQGLWETAVGSTAVTDTELPWKKFGIKPAPEAPKANPKSGAKVKKR